MLPQLHIDNNQIVKGYTPGQEYVIARTREEYTGLYHVYPNGAVYSNAEYNTDSVELIKLPDTYFKSPQNILYRALTSFAFDNYVLPTYYMANPTAKEIEIGVMSRYICQKRNELDNMLEINKDQALSGNRSNRRGIDLNIWNITRIEWSIQGAQSEVISANRRVLSYASTKMPGIQNYLSDLLEFYQ